MYLCVWVYMCLCLVLPGSVAMYLGFRAYWLHFRLYLPQSVDFNYLQLLCSFNLNHIYFRLKKYRISHLLPVERHIGHLKYCVYIDLCRYRYTSIRVLLQIIRRLISSCSANFIFNAIGSYISVTIFVPGQYPICYMLISIGSRWQGIIHAFCLRFNMCERISNCFPIMPLSPYLLCRFMGRCLQLLSHLILTHTVTPTRLPTVTYSLRNVQLTSINTHVFF